MSRNGTANLVLIGLAVIGALIVVPTLLSAFGSVLGLVIVLLVWMVTGYIAGRLVRGQSFGTLGDIVMGLLGGFVGTILLGLFGIHLPTFVGAIITGVIGAVALVYIVRLLGKRDFAR